MDIGLELPLFASFEGGPSMQSDTSDFRNITLTAPKFVITGDGARYQAPVGGKSDLASIPRGLWGPPEYLTPFGIYAPAAVIHDGAYQNWLLSFQDGLWLPANLTKERSDDLFNALMFASGVDDETRLKLYNGVRFGGWKAFREDRA